MDIHEYQAKELFAAYGIPVMAGSIAHTPQEVEKIAASLQTPLVVVKAQVHAGGRGKGGGVRLAKTPQEAARAAEDILSKPLITPQTKASGQKVDLLYVEMGCAFEQQFYVSLMVDRATGWVMVMGSAEGGMDIEEVSQHAPEKIVTMRIDPTTGYQPFHGRLLARRLGCVGPHVQKLSDVLKALYKMIWDLDLSLIEINPLALTSEGVFMALDAKLSFDDNALYRHPQIAALRDVSQEDPAEVEASQFNLSYVRLDGNIGCMVNGAGLAMATMDIIQHYGGSPANFLDVGGGATKEKVTEAFRLILSDPRVEGILVNIFGGIMRCDIIAEGILAAAQDMHVRVPLVVRLEGTNVEQGVNILRQSDLAITSAQGLADAASQIVQAVRGIH